MLSNDNAKIYGRNALEFRLFANFYVCSINAKWQCCFLREEKTEKLLPNVIWKRQLKSHLHYWANFPIKILVFPPAISKRIFFARCADIGFLYNILCHHFLHCCHLKACRMWVFNEMIIFFPSNTHQIFFPLRIGISGELFVEFFHFIDIPSTPKKNAERMHKFSNLCKLTIISKFFECDLKHVEYVCTRGSMHSCSSVW